MDAFMVLGHSPSFSSLDLWFSSFSWHRQWPQSRLDCWSQTTQTSASCPRHHPPPHRLVLHRHHHLHPQGLLHRPFLHLHLLPLPLHHHYHQPLLVILLIVSISPPIASLPYLMIMFLFIALVLPSTAVYVAFCSSFLVVSLGWLSCSAFSFVFFSLRFLFLLFVAGFSPILSSFSQRLFDWAIWLDHDSHFFKTFQTWWSLCQSWRIRSATVQR